MSRQSPESSGVYGVICEGSGGPDVITVKGPTGIRFRGYQWMNRSTRKRAASRSRVSRGCYTAGFLNDEFLPEDDGPDMNVSLGLAIGTSGDGTSLLFRGDALSKIHYRFGLSQKACHALKRLPAQEWCSPQAPVVLDGNRSPECWIPPKRLQGEDSIRLFLGLPVWGEQGRTVVQVCIGRV